MATPQAVAEPEQIAPRPVADLIDMTAAEQAAEYYRLCDIRDRVYRTAEPLEKELTALNAQIETARLKAEAKAKELDATRAVVGPEPDAWLRLKRRIASLVKLMGGRVPARAEPAKTTEG